MGHWEPGEVEAVWEIVQWQDVSYYSEVALKVLFSVASLGLTSVGIQRVLFTRPWFPKIQKEGIVMRKKAWRAQNTSLSLVHSSVAGCWALLSFVLFPETMGDMIFANNPFNFHMVIFSVGYFVYDAIDIVRHEVSARTVELLFHHLICVYSFVSALVVRRFFPFAAVALLMELNSVCLHLRLLVTLHGLPRTTARYRLISLANVGTFVVFRMLLTAWMLRWVLGHRDVLPTFFFLVGSVGLAAMSAVNLALFYRILVADHFWTPKSLKGKEQEGVDVLMESNDTILSSLVGQKVD